MKKLWLLTLSLFLLQSTVYAKSQLDIRTEIKNKKYSEAAQDIKELADSGKDVLAISRDFQKATGKPYTDFLGTPPPPTTAPTTAPIKKEFDQAPHYDETQEAYLEFSQALDDKVKAQAFINAYNTFKNAFKPDEYKPGTKIPAEWTAGLANAKTSIAKNGGGGATTQPVQPVIDPTLAKAADDAAKEAMTVAGQIEALTDPTTKKAMAAKFTPFADKIKAIK